MILTNHMQKIIPNLWFDTHAKEAAEFYISVFGEGKITKVTHYDGPSAEVSGQPEGSILTVEFELKGQEFLALNGGPLFKFNESVSFAIDCADQAEVDHFWNSLTADGGQESQCGWLKDKYGLSWQVVPNVLNKLMSDPNKAKATAAMQAMLKMQKLDIAKLQAAYDAA